MKKLLIMAMIFATGLTQAEMVASAPKTGWEHLRVGILGDSITDSNQTRTQKVYWQYLAEWYQWDKHVYGISGHTWGNIPGQIDRMIAEQGDNLDAVLIFVGTNDYASGLPLGEWYEEIPGKVNWWGTEIDNRQRKLSRNGGTLCGRVNLALEKLRKRYPDIQIVIMTPTKRGYFKYSEQNVQAGDDWQNTAGLHLEDYVKTIRAGAEIWGCPIIDLYAEAPLLPQLPEHAKLYRNGETDLLHPATAGHERLARLIYARLSAIPGTYR